MAAFPFGPSLPQSFLPVLPVLSLLLSGSTDVNRTGQSQSRWKRGSEKAKLPTADLCDGPRREELSS